MSTVLLKDCHMGIRYGVATLVSQKTFDFWFSITFLTEIGPISSLSLVQSQKLDINDLSAAKQLNAPNYAFNDSI
jgi:hypothetical protein